MQADTLHLKMRASGMLSKLILYPEYQTGSQFTQDTKWMLLRGK